jgi:hypothetical protein
MSDPSSKPPSIPSWQQQSGSAPTDQSPSSPPNSDDAPASAPRQDLLDQASKFLQDESIRDASTDRKVSFLESKGLTSDEIQQLLGVSRNPEASSAESTAAEAKAQETSSIASPSDQSEVTPSSPATSSTSPSSSTMSQPRSTPATSTTSSTAARDVPPIITYPEFLFQPAKPPPLVTMSRILYTIYGAAGLGASIYGASEYLVKPMLANLTSARLDLANTAKVNLQKLNEKLEQNVSIVPAHLTARKKGTEDGAEDSSDSDSIISDPTELFHRDIGTQTTPDVSTTSRSSSSKDPAETAADAPSIAVNKHLTRLESIQSSLKEVSEFEKDSITLDDSMRTRLTDLHHYLDGLLYAAPTYTATAGYGGLYSGTTTTSDSSSSGVRKSEEDAIAAFKAEIRGVKGALLSARNFPASRGGRLAGGMAGR